MNERIETFFAFFDAHLQSGLPSDQALDAAAQDYAYIFFHDDGRTELARSATRALLIKGVNEHED